ncbi:phage holin family protein, partial [Variovorax sp. Varisp62]
MRLSSLFGLNARIRRLRIAAAEGALAAEDRVQLLRMAWEDEKQRLKLLLVFSLAVLGLTTVTVALLSVAVVVHFWETPHRIAAAWSVAG